MEHSFPGSSLGMPYREGPPSSSRERMSIRDSGGAAVACRLTPAPRPVCGDQRSEVGSRKSEAQPPTPKGLLVLRLILLILFLLFLVLVLILVLVLLLFLASSAREPVRVAP